MARTLRMWTLVEGCDVIRNIQEAVKPYGYHAALGGGVLNNGCSDKDLDIYFLELDVDSGSNPHNLLAFLQDHFEVEGESITRADYPDSRYAFKWKFILSNDKRIDVFIS